MPGSPSLASTFGPSTASHVRSVRTPPGSDPDPSTACVPLVVGISGARQNATVAAVVDGRLTSVCEQERITRVRSAPLQSSLLPQEALSAVLQPIGCGLSDIHLFVTAEPAAVLPSGLSHLQVNHHYAHAATATLTSSVRAAAVLVCDSDPVSPATVWSFESGRLIDRQWSWSGTGFANLYSECADLFRLGRRGEHRLEALARLGQGDYCEQLRGHIQYRHGMFHVCPDWKAAVTDLLLGRDRSGDLRRIAAVASSFQRCIADALVALVGEIRAALPFEELCLGGGLFYNTYFNTRIVESGAFKRVFVPVNPGNAGLAAGAALAVAQAGNLRGNAASAFLGPNYDCEQIKATLDNCKVTYDYLSEAQVLDTTVQALRRGALVGWFQGPMEWGHRALGNRSILANPLSPHVLDNLNDYLKQREGYRAYGVSVCEEEAPLHFHVSAPSRFMELEYVPVDPSRFRYILPPGARTMRVQTIEEPSPFRDLHRAFAAATGIGVLVNTSFNGFHEPIVCSPRDAIRVFYGTGLDVLVLGRFVIRK
jgi:carbamoyltransferase